MHYCVTVSVTVYSHSIIGIQKELFEEFTVVLNDAPVHTGLDLYGDNSVFIAVLLVNYAVIHT